VKTNNPEKNHIYQEEKPRPARRSWFFLPQLLLFLAALLLVHFLNIFLQWTVIRQELAHGPVFHSPEYTFLGFSLFNQEKIAAVKLLPNAAANGRIFAFFDLSHPVVFLVWNNSRGEDFFDMGPVIVAVPAGASGISIFPSQVFSLQHGQRAVVKNFGGSILGRAWTRILSQRISKVDGENDGTFGSFVFKQAEKSRYLKIPYLLYFYLPLVLILLLIGSSGPAMAAAFFYNVEMFFLFDFQKLFVTVPLAWLFRALKIDLPDSWATILAVFFAVLFLAFSIFGLWRWKNADIPRRHKWAVLFFILLPFSLFF
jgi:hypothetical protein